MSDPRKNIARKRKLRRRIVARERARQQEEVQPTHYVIPPGSDVMEPAGGCGQMECGCKAHARRLCKSCRGTGTVLYE